MFRCLLTVFAVPFYLGYVLIFLYAALRWEISLWLMMASELCWPHPWATWVKSHSYSALEVWFIYLAQGFLSDWLSSCTAQLGWNGGFSCVSPSLHISLTPGTNGIMRNLHGGIVFRDTYHHLFPIPMPNCF